MTLLDTRPDGRVPARDSIAAPTALSVLTARLMRAGVREGQFFFSFGSPIVFFVCLYVPLYRRFAAYDGGYAQYLTPVIILQAAMFAAIISAEIAAAEAQDGVRDRLASLPMERWLPVASRILYAAVRILVATAGAVVIGSAFGFRFHGSWWQSAQFVVLAIVFAVGLSMLTDSLAQIAAHPDSLVQILMIPQLLLVMLSTGLVPAQAFPDWIAPVVRNQPVSIFSDSMRTLSNGVAPHYLPVVAWSLGLLVAGVVAVMVAARSEVRR
ncbi:putative ABC transporter permease protein [Gordonia effusa NBRC 100432]|uniref:Putative ABC transporter permease protein n=1 Tax=Gordonia effusa NBRC 100432 TaxID=1077974 RepID=H0QXR3_9ACTN|nr:ABC transporter permease [Gordonia effusa]GAB17614.1 putative ABC transporter permease protein [Gordonia effusa NBRC 100432]